LTQTWTFEGRGLHWSGRVEDAAGQLFLPHAAFSGPCSQFLDAIADADVVASEGVASPFDEVLAKALSPPVNFQPGRLCRALEGSRYLLIRRTMEVP